MKAFALVVLLALGAGHALAAPDPVPDIKVSNREFPDGSGASMKTIDREKREAIEAFFINGNKLNYRIIYQLDDWLDPVSAIYYNASGKVFQKSVYRLGEASFKNVTNGRRVVSTTRQPARIEQEVVYDAFDRFVCTKQYIYGSGNRGGGDTVRRIDFYDINGKPLESKRKPVQSPQATHPVRPIPR